jgi:hypothetical protein
MQRIETYFNEQTETLTLDVAGHVLTLDIREAWALLDAIERELIGPSLVADHRGD